MSFTPLNNMTIDPKYDQYSLSVSITKQKAPIDITFALSFLFFSFFFSKSKHLIITMASSSCYDLHLLHHLECATYLMIT